LFDEKKGILKLLLPKSPITDSFNKYVYLEKALLAKRENKRNNGFFTSSDALKLMNAFNISKTELFETYCRIYYINESTDEQDIRPNFDKMLNSKRNPTVLLIEALIDLILNGEVLQDNVGNYYSTDARIQRNSLSFREYCKVNSYLTFCLAISKLENKHLKPYELEVGTRILIEKSLEDIESIRPLLRTNTLLSEYIYPTDIDEWEPHYNDYSEYYNDFWEPFPWESPDKIIDYISICDEWKNNDSNMYNYFDDASNGLLLFLRNNIYMLGKLDKNFWQLLFLLQFLTYDNLERLMKYQPMYTFTVKKEHCNDYYNYVKQIIELPNIEEVFPLSSDVRDAAIKAIVLSKKDAQHLPDWTYFVMHNISQQHLTTAKYLYLTLVLGYRYRHTEQYKKLPQELLNLFIELNNINIKEYIDEIDNLKFDL
jgi:hypothetical protein